MTEEFVPQDDTLVPAPVEVIEENDEDLDPANVPAPTEDDTPEQIKARLAESEEARKKLYARLQREKNKGKTATVQPAKEEPKPTTLSRDEAILIAKGFSTEELEKANKIAEIENIPLTSVPDNDLFKSWKSKRDEEVKAEKAALGVSKGSRATVKRSFNTPGLSDDEHKEMFMEKYQG